MLDDANPLDPAQTRSLAQVRRLMMIALLTTCVAIGLVFVVIGYKIYRSGDSVEAAAVPPDLTVALPAGARVITTAIGSDHIMVTIDVGGTTEIRTFDPHSLKPLGRLRLEAKP